MQDEHFADIAGKTGALGLAFVEDLVDHAERENVRAGGESRRRGIEMNRQHMGPPQLCDLCGGRHGQGIARGP